MTKEQTRKRLKKLLKLRTSRLLKHKNQQRHEEELKRKLEKENN